MSWHMAAYTLATGGAVTDADMVAAVDPELQARGGASGLGHYTLTEDYDVKAIYAGAPNLTRARFSVNKWNQLSLLNIWPINKSANIPSPPQLDFYDRMPLRLPQTEEIALKATDSANEQVTVFLWLAPSNWNANIPPALHKYENPDWFEIRVTATTPSLTANTWSGLSAVTFEQTLRSGVYAVIGATFQATNLMAARFVFGRAPVYNNRKLRPGFLANNAIGDLEWQVLQDRRFFMGEAGRFHIYEPPQIEYWSNTTGIATVESRWWVVWIGEGKEVQY